MPFAFAQGWLSRFHRARPSTSLDKSSARYLIVGDIYNILNPIYKPLVL